VTALRLHRSIYAGEAVDEAVKRFQPFGVFELREEPDHWVVEIHGGERERRIAGELGNYALGLTVKRGGVTS
jgi:hypothetical protein